MDNTDLVLILRDAGISERRAEAFERLIDDARFVGIGSVLLYRIIALTVKKQIYYERQAVRLELQQQQCKDKKVLELFESSAYGTYVARGRHPG